MPSCALSMNAGLVTVNTFSRISLILACPNPLDDYRPKWCGAIHRKEIITTEHSKTRARDLECTVGACLQANQIRQDLQAYPTPFAGRPAPTESEHSSQEQ